MRNATQLPRRMRFSFGSRCRLVGLVLAGESPSSAAAACGASRATGYRLLQRYREGGWAALLDRPPVPRRQPRHRLSKLLLRHGAVYDATAWTRAHDAWLRKQRFQGGPLAIVFDECYSRMIDAKTRRDTAAGRIRDGAATTQPIPASAHARARP